MTENPFKLRVVGGTDFEKKLAKIGPHVEEMFHIRMLTNKWAELMGSNHNYQTETTEGVQKEVRALTAEELYQYLSSSFIDEYPEHTSAILLEVYQRSQLNDFSPRQ